MYPELAVANRTPVYGQNFVSWDASATTQAATNEQEVEARKRRAVAEYNTRNYVAGADLSNVVVSYKVISDLIEASRTLRAQKIKTPSDFYRSNWFSSVSLQRAISPQQITNAYIFLAILELNRGQNAPRDRKISQRLLALYRDALAEGEVISHASIKQFTEFFAVHPDLGLPKITLTPDGTLRVRWIEGEGSFTAIEFIGKASIKMAAEIPRQGDQPAHYFGTENAERIVDVARGMGAFFG